MDRSAELTEDYQKVSAKLTEQQMKEQVTQTINSYMEQIKAQNESMREWETNMVLGDGYTVNGRSISRTTIVDSTLVNNVKKSQSVYMYEDFVAARPDITVSSEGGETGENMIEKIMLAIDHVKQWAVKIFGQVNADGKTKSREIDKKDFQSKEDTSKTAQALVDDYKESAGKYDVSKNSWEKNHKERLAELQKKVEEKGFDKLSENEQKEYTDLSGRMTELQDGAINEWIGYAPTFKDGNELDFDKSARENVKYEGMGQMGLIMLDFQWNSMEEGQGFAELAKPMYDKKMWDDNGSWLQPPTFRDVLDIVLEVVGNATGHKWIGYLDDLLFAATDLTGGYKTAGQVGLELGKKVATKAVSSGIGSAAGAVSSGLTSGVSSTVGKTLIQTGVNMTSAAATTVANTAINSVNIGPDGKLMFDSKGFGQSLGKMSAWSGVVSAGISGTMNAFTQTDGLDKALNGNVFNNGGIQRFNALAGSLAASGMEYLIDGETSFNILNAADLFAMFGSEYLDKSKEIDFGNGTKGFAAASTGLFELKFSKEKGISGAIGRGGADLSFLHTQAALAGAHDSLKILGAKAGNLLGMKEGISTLDAVNGLSYTNNAMNISLANDIWNDKIKVKYDVEGDAYGYSDVDNRGTIHLSKDLLGTDGEKMAKLASVMAHEGTHAYGNRIEGKAHAQAGLTYSAILQEYKLAGDNSFADAIMAGYNDAENWKENSGDRDYWKIKMKADGTHELVFDGKKYLSIDYLDADGNVISTSKIAEEDQKIALAKRDNEGNLIRDDRGNLQLVGMAESLTRELGMDRIKEIVKEQYGINTDLARNIPIEVIASALEMPVSAVEKISDSVLQDLYSKNKAAILGEFVMSKMGASWDEKNTKWINTDGIKLTITDKAYNGNIMAEVQNGKYLYSTVNATLFRDPDSWKSLVGTADKNDPTNKNKVSWKNSEIYSNLDVRVFTKNGINWNFSESYIDEGVQSIDNMYMSISHPEGNYNQAYYDDTNKRWVQGNTIISEYYNMQYVSTSGSYEGNVLIKNNAWTIDGNWVGNDGKDSRSDDRWLAHANRKKGAEKDWNTTRSDGCDIESYIKQKAMLDQLEKWNLTSGYQIKTHLVNQKYQR